MPSILVRSSWQTLNIGDISHTPGLLSLLGQHLPEAEIRLWPSDVGQGVEAMLRRHFPNLALVRTEAEIDAALAECDFLLHGSGPYLVGEDAVARWKSATRKPYGVYGITMPPVRLTDAVRELLNGARFVYFRDTVSLRFAREHGVKCPVMEFAPDAAFAVNLSDDGRSEVFLNDHRLEDGKFLCCIGRYRITPHWRIPEKNRGPDPVKEARNNALKEQDHAPLRAAICGIVRGTDLKVLLCPEDRTQMEISREMLWDPLPHDVRERVVWRENYWLTDEALSTYRRSAGLFGNEMHSPIMCIGHGIPALVARWEEQTSKGFMWSDIGLGDWLFDFDRQSDRGQFPEFAIRWAQNLPEARLRADGARELVEQRHRETMVALRLQVGLPTRRR